MVGTRLECAPEGWEKNDVTYGVNGQFKNALDERTPIDLMIDPPSNMVCWAPMSVVTCRPLKWRSSISSRTREAPLERLHSVMCSLATDVRSCSPRVDHDSSDRDAPP